MGSKAGSASKVKLNSFDDLFGGAENATGEQIINAKLSDLHTFKGHPFRVLDDEKMEETTESIRKYGVLVPGLARPKAEGGYEIIAGHRRKRGSESARLEAHRSRKKIAREKLVQQAETDPAAAAELEKKRAYASEATKKSRQKMYEEAATGNPEAVERYENYLAARREAYHRKKQEAERTA